MAKYDLSKITFKNYKAFKEVTEMELRPITLLVGKNSSGKSSICKLLPLLSGSLSSEKKGSIQLVNDGIWSGARYEDLFHYNDYTDLTLGLEYKSGISLRMSYLMHNGRFLPRELRAQNNNEYNICSLIDSTDENRDTQIVDFFSDLSKIGINFNELVFHVDYIGPIRKMPERTLYTGSPIGNGIGYRGENMFPLLLNSYLQNDQLFSLVSTWTEKHLESQKLEIIPLGPETGSYGLYVHRKGAVVNIADMGQGLAQVLPIITEAFMSNNADITIIEQPALHLHPAAHAAVSECLGNSAKRLGRKYLIETHSENILLGFRKMITDPAVDFNPDDIIIYFVDTDENTAFLRRIEIDANGNLSTWPEGVFGEGYELLMDIMRNAR